MHEPGVWSRMKNDGNKAWRRGLTLVYGMCWSTVGIIAFVGEQGIWRSCRARSGRRAERRGDLADIVGGVWLRRALGLRTPCPENVRSPFSASSVTVICLLMIVMRSQAVAWKGKSVD